MERVRSHYPKLPAGRDFPSFPRRLHYAGSRFSPSEAAKIRLADRRAERACKRACARRLEKVGVLAVASDIIHTFIPRPAFRCTRNCVCAPATGDVSSVHPPPSGRKSTLLIYADAGQASLSRSSSRLISSSLASRFPTERLPRSSSPAPTTHTPDRVVRRRVIIFPPVLCSRNAEIGNFFRRRNPICRKKGRETITRRYRGARGLLYIFESSSRAAGAEGRGRNDSKELDRFHPRSVISFFPSAGQRGRRRSRPEYEENGVSG